MKATVVKEKFKVLRAVDSSSLSGAKPFELPPQEQQFDFPNAPGGLRLVTYDEVRAIMRESALRTLKALKDAAGDRKEI